MNKTHQFLAEKAWLMPGGEYARLLQTILPLVKGGTAIDVLQQPSVSCYATTPYMADRWELDDTSLPDGSVAVLVLDGPIYSWDTFRLEQLLLSAEQNPRIAGVVLWVNGPGGMGTYIDVVARQIATFPKPVSTFVAGYMLSAHFWLGTAASRVFAASPLCEVGSVGVLASYVSMREHYRQQGIDYREIYPDTSDLKNKWFRDIEDGGDETLLKAQLQALHQAFCEAVSANTGIPYDPGDPFFRGATLTGQEAMDRGVIHQTGTLRDACQWVLAQSTLNDIRKNS